MTSTESRHFTLTPLADGVFAAVHRPGGWAIANAGVVDLGDRTLVFDTGMTPAAGAELRRAAEEVGNRPVDLVINSHYHNDHIWGNQAFSTDTPIMAAAATRQLIETAGRDEVELYGRIAAQRQAALQAAYDAAPDEPARAAISPWLTYFSALAATMPDLEVCLPDRLFERRLDIRGSRRTATLLEFANGHTGSDTVLHLPEERILFAGDLLFVETHPYLGDGDPFNLRSILVELAVLEAETLVPGHGPVAGSAVIQTLGGYIDDVIALAARCLEQGLAPDDMTEFTIPTAYRQWDLGRFFAGNVVDLYRRLAAGDGA